MPGGMMQGLQAVMVEAARLSLWLALLMAIFVPLERLFGIDPQRVWRRGMWADLLFYFGNGVLLNVVLAVPVALLATLLRHGLPTAVTNVTAAMPFSLRLLATFVVGELGFYWGHRWSHEIPLLWRFHRVHHTPEEVDWLVNTRAHPVDLVFTRLCGWLPIFALGLGAPTANGAGLAPLLLAVVGTVFGFFVHANLRWRFGWLESVVATPAFHRWHHTADEWRDHNYASVLPMLDRLFGTLYAPRNAWPRRYGLGEPMSRRRLAQLRRAHREREASGNDPLSMSAPPEETVLGTVR
jgi:sterol desaturase/sphingolipid hydroxylase (fatty acid hydroxylase superfamily)